VLDTVLEKFKVAQTIDLSHFENENAFLEGTGSMVLDRENKIAYACLSPRTDKDVLDEFCHQMGLCSCYSLSRRTRMASPFIIPM
jgi:hypothetical protein